MAFVRFRCVPAFYIYNKKHNKTKQKHIFQNKSSSSSKLHPFEEMEKKDLQFLASNSYDFLPLLFVLSSSS